ncbi:cytochrome c [Labilibacter sediminis]|nr:cytochrome c [Labilibacter sediminis]
MRKFLGKWTILLVIIMLAIACQNKAKDSNLKSEQVTEGENVVGDLRIEEGEMVYNRNCKVCHQPGAKGVPGIYPPVINTKRVNGDSKYLINVLLNGLSGEMKVEGKKYNGVMAPYRNLSDQEIADVLNYLRRDLKDEDKLVSAQQVSDMR